MSYQIISGSKMAKNIIENLKKEVKDFQSSSSIVLGLAVVIIGDNPASRVYVNHKKKACEEVGLTSFEYSLPKDVSEKELLKLIQDLNQDKRVHGILVQLPLPDHLDPEKILLEIDPSKDVDGFHPFNLGQMLRGYPHFLPCTPYGIVEMLKRSNIQTESQHVVVIGRSNIVGKPLGAMLLQKGANANATVTICHSRTKDMEKITQQADILVAAIGKPLFVKADMVKKGAVVIDVGINALQDAQAPKGYRLVGDVAFEEVAPRCSAITPVPGGVGPMTIAMLLTNTLKAGQYLMNQKGETS
ncbi:bifunctional 5,10-methylene-tetrahydrofolate dehydrogenase/5,10-methylene-tetrahydrofolate cyclohydrolase [PVC group bacterium (ex Bugula neritina AB1)]|nr:bifunctional 5,10-methylene-tetrahydrofolate dehydrogenase/5,10-methylene-tetrahydrofolate cyclohydrolase [PVC group bacterium (ex Bugula neritina AB1)]